MSQSTNLLDALREILLIGRVKTQNDIQLALEDLGYSTNQSKISRLLRKLGAIKVINDQGQTVYRLPHDYTPPPTKAALTQLVTEVLHNEAMIVVRTSPGSASLIARLLDHRYKEMGILGSVAGDDTILITPTSTQNIDKTCQEIKAILATVKL